MKYVVRVWQYHQSVVILHLNRHHNMKYKISEIASIISPESIIRHDDEINVLLTDSRSLAFPSSSLFFAIKTKGNDGHQYIESLYESGVRNFVITKIPQNLLHKKDANFLVVENVVEALQLLSKAHRQKFKIPTIAIAGSKGKTTVKEWLFQLLTDDYNITRSPRSFNSQIGVPLSLWEINPQTELALIEAGISQKGEMQVLKQLINPTSVIITNIEDDHSSDFSSITEKIEEEIILAESAQTIIYNADDEQLASKLASKYQQNKLIGWSQIAGKASIHIEISHHDTTTTIKYKFGNKSDLLSLPFTSKHDIENSINALAMLLSLGVATTDINKRFLQLHKIGTRLNVSDGVNNCSIIYDSFTCDYTSLWSALDFMCRRATIDKSRTLILGELQHERAYNDELFAAIAYLIEKAKIDRFIGIGESYLNYRNIFISNSQFYSSTEEFMSAMSTSDFSNELILIKGSPEHEFSHIVENLEAKKHETVLEVNLDSIVKNYNYFRQNAKAGTGIVAMVKASGYGAGSYEIAKTLQAQGAAYLAVAVLDEGIDLRNAGITMPIMVMNPKVVNYKSMFAYNLEPEIYSMEMLSDVIREAKKNGMKEYPVHIKLDTGMHRMGFIKEELETLMQILNSQNHIIAASVFSHLATADCLDMDKYTNLQLSRFEEYTQYMLSNYSRHIRRHILNTAGILRFPQYSYDMVRLGIGLYGANTLPYNIEKPLEVVSTLRTIIISIREWAEGETIGYGRKGTLKRKSKIATIPIGYADGMNRRFGNGNSRVYINGKYAPTIGNICMDACMIDVTDIDCTVGDNVEIFGNNISVQELADVLGTIPYEILTSVSPRVKRIYFRE